MQKVKYLLVLVMSIFSFSCQKSNMYSCDPDIERWANENVLEISRMSRMQFLNLKKDSYKRAAYRIFDTEKKREIWNEKYQELEKLDWSEVEWKHIDLIYSLILDYEKSIFTSIDLNNNDELLIFIYRWQEYANNTLGWNKKQIHAICYSIEKVLNKQGDLDKNFEDEIIALTQGEGVGFECSCSQKSSYCDILDHEGPDYTTCRTPTRGSCKPTSGCGLFWLFECDGMCLGLGI